jgi:hypothetical protein
MKTTVKADPRLAYVKTVLREYVWLPGTPKKASRQDWCLAASLYDRNVPLHAVRSALCLAGARRSLRLSQAPPLQPVRSLHYFTSTLDEVLAMPLDPGYVDYLHSKLQPLAQAKLVASSQGA